MTRGPELPQHMVPAMLWALSSLMADRHGNVPAEVRYAHRWLTTMSAVGHETHCDEAPLDEDDLIGTAEAATLLGCSARTVRRLRVDLDGAQPAGTHLVFSRRSVIRYAAAREGKAAS